jgi:hypothetical protein
MNHRLARSMVHARVEGDKIRSNKQDFTRIYADLRGSTKAFFANLEALYAAK